MKLDKYKVIPLARILNNAGGEEAFQSIVHNFSCPPNEDVEHFLKHTAIANQNMGLSRTNLIFLDNEEEPLLLGYYALALQVLDLSQVISKSMLKKITGFKRVSKLGAAVYLIGQLGKNFNNGANQLITGKEIFMLAMQDILDARTNVGGRIVVVECKNEEHLRNFYASTLNFQLINTADDKDMLKYMTLISTYDKQAATPPKQQSS